MPSYTRVPGRTQKERNDLRRKPTLELLAAQGGKCAICRSETTTGKGWHRDHNHITGQIRGALCHKCNVGLGCFRDDPALLNEAIAYLARWGTTTKESEHERS